MKTLLLFVAVAIAVTLLYWAAGYDAIHSRGYHMKNVIALSGIAFVFAIIMREIHSLSRKRGA